MVPGGADSSILLETSAQQDLDFNCCIILPAKVPLTLLLLTWSKVSIGLRFRGQLAHPQGASLVHQIRLRSPGTITLSAIRSPPNQNRAIRNYETHRPRGRDISPARTR